MKVALVSTGLGRILRGFEAFTSSLYETLKLRASGLDVTLFQGVTLGGTGKETGDRHPKVRRGVMIGAGAEILGNIEIGEGSKVAAGSVVLKPVPAHTAVAGVPARPIGKPSSDIPAYDMKQELE